MYIKHFAILLVLLLLGSQATLGAQPLMAKGGAAVQMDPEIDALIAAWTLPHLIYESSTQTVQQCVQVAFEVSQWSRNFTGTLSYFSTGSVTYQPTPRDRLRVISADGSQIEFEILEIQGYFEGGPDEFLANNYQLTCHIKANDWIDLTVNAEQTGASFLSSTLLFKAIGRFTYAETDYWVDMQTVSDLYFEASFGGSEYRNHTELQGDITSLEFDLTVDDIIFHHMVTSGDRSASVNNRATNSRWRMDGRGYAFENVALNRSFRDGRPVRLDTEWRATGAIRRDNRSWGTVTGQHVDDFYRIWAVIPNQDIQLEFMTLSAHTPAPPLRNDEAKRKIQVEGETTLLQADENERARLAIDLYRQIGLGEESAAAFVAVMGVSDDVMIALIIIAARFYNIDHKYEEAIDLLEQTLADLEGKETPDLEAALLNEIGKTYYYLGDMELALDLLTRALENYQALGNAEQQAVVLANRGLIYEGRGEYEVALTAYLEALETYESIQAQRTNDDTSSTTQALAMVHLPFHLGTIYNNVGSLYHTLGENRKAEEAYEEALTISREASDLSGEAITLHNLGRLYGDLGRYDQALEKLFSALEISRARDNILAEGHILRSLGEVYNAQEAYEMAVQRYSQALESFQQIGNTSNVAWVLNSLGVVYVNLAQYDQAERHFQKALNFFDSNGYRTDQAITLSNLGFVQEQVENSAEALDLYRQAVAVIESIQSELRVEEVKSAFLANQSNLYAYLIDFLWQTGEQSEAFDYAERARARAFLDLIGNPRVDLGGQAAATLVEQAEDLRHRILNLQNLLSAERAKIDQHDNAQLLELSRELETARNTYEQLLLRLKLTNPEYASLVQVETLSLDSVQEQILDAETTLIAYFVLDNRTLAWVIDQETVKTVQLEVGRDELRRQIEFLRDLIDQPEFDADVAADLYAQLVVPLMPHIRHANLVIVPHDVLHYLPFAALWNPTDEQYMIENFALTYAPSASALQFLQAKRSPNKGQLLAMGNPDGSLPHAATEVQAIADQFGTSPLLRNRASESHFRTQAARFDILHLAAHGAYNPINPRFTRVELMPDTNQDGYLEVHEIFGLDLSEANLVVLSACETALGEQNSGDEIVGLTRAFLYAGSPSVITTLWNIDSEASSALMTVFYSHLQSGEMSIAEALRQAQIEVMTQWPEPRHWAAFVLNGDSDW